MAKPRGRPFPKGVPGPGRKAGVPNKATREMKAWAQGVLERPEIQAAAIRDIQRNPSGALSLFYHAHAYGKPKDTLTVEGGPKALVVRILGDDPA